jgi:hypothetical protein
MYFVLRLRDGRRRIRQSAEGNGPTRLALARETTVTAPASQETPVQRQGVASPGFQSASALSGMVSARLASRQVEVVLVPAV